MLHLLQNVYETCLLYHQYLFIKYLNQFINLLYQILYVYDQYQIFLLIIYHLLFQSRRSLYLPLNLMHYLLKYLYYNLILHLNLILKLINYHFLFQCMYYSNLLLKLINYHFQLLYKQLLNFLLNLINHHFLFLCMLYFNLLLNLINHQFQLQYM